MITKTIYLVTTVLTACGIETDFHQTIHRLINLGLQQYLPLAVLKRCQRKVSYVELGCVLFKLQQYLPLAVLKLCSISSNRSDSLRSLQQYLPLAVLKLTKSWTSRNWEDRYNSTYLYDIE